jgi:type I restriction enzyme S subunit
MIAPRADDWLRLPISEIADFGSGDMISVAQLSQRSGLCPVPVFGGNGIAGYTSSATVSAPTVILGRVGQKCGVVSRNTGPAWITDNALYARRFRRSVDVRFFALALEAARLNDVRNRNDLPLITQSILNDVRVAWPKSLEEQRQIADALSDVEALSVTLQRRIAKKRAMKLGLMQQLLQGRTRLPGFDEPWGERKIGEFAAVRAGGTPSTGVSGYWGGDIPWMSSGEIHQKQVHGVRGRITRLGLQKSSAQVMPPGTVLMALAGQGKTRGTVAVSRIQLTTNQSIAGMYPGDEHDPDYLYYTLDARYAELRGESAGDGGRGGLNLTIIKRLVVPFPTREEQRAIARVLLDADAEIAVLNDRLAKARAVKVGMMQQLLTGRVRLAPTEAVV